LIRIETDDFDPAISASADRAPEGAWGTPETLSICTLAFTWTRRAGPRLSGAPAASLGPASRISAAATEAAAAAADDTTSTRLPLSRTTTESSELLALPLDPRSKGATMEAATRAERSEEEEEEEGEAKEAREAPLPAPSAAAVVPVGAAAAPASHARALTAAAQRSKSAEAGSSALPATLWSRSQETRSGEGDKEDPEPESETPNSTRPGESDDSLRGSRSSGCCLGLGHALPLFQEMKDGDDDDDDDENEEGEEEPKEEEEAGLLPKSTACALTPDIPNADADARGTTAKVPASLLPLP